MAIYTREREKIAREVAEEIWRRFSYQIEEISLYGSVARGEDRKNSDIDLLVLYSNVLNTLPVMFFGSPAELSYFIRELEEKYRKKGYKIEINLRNRDKFYEKIENIKKRLKNGENLDYLQRFALNVMREKKVLYAPEVVNYPTQETSANLDPTAQENEDLEKMIRNSFRTF